MLLFLLTMSTKFNDNTTPSFFVKYYSFQRVQSIILLFLIFKREKFLITIIIFIKIGIPPFHSWILDILKKINYTQFFLLNIIQKFPLLLVSLNLINHQKTIFFRIRVIRRLVTIFLIINSRTLNEFFYFGSSFSIVTLLLFQTSFFKVLIWLLIYSLVRMILLLICSKENFNTPFNLNSENFVIILLFIRRFPPLLSFWIKMFLLRKIVETRILVSFSFAIISFIIFFLLFRVWCLLLRLKGMDSFIKERKYKLIFYPAFLLVLSPYLIIIFYHDLFKKILILLKMVILINILII